jgi:hypothetical protein
MTVFKYLVVWLLGLAVGLCAIGWHPIAEEATWTSQIQRGELLLLAVTLSVTAVGYAVIGAGSGKRDALKYIVIFFGVVVAVLCLLLYASFSQGALHSEHSVAWKSYVALTASALLGVSAVVLTESERV